MGKIIKQFVITAIAVVISLELGPSVGLKFREIALIATETAAALTALSTLATALSSKKPVRATSITEQRLNKQIDPEAPRKMVFGNTIAPVDLRYWETYGTDNTKYDEVIVVATHEIESFGDFYLESQKYTFDGSGNSNILGAAFNRTTRTVGVTGTSLPVGVGVKWTTTSSMTGMAFYVLKYIYSQKDWPQGFPNRITQVIKGAKVYDPRLDSTVPGGTGTHRISNQATWQYNDGITDIGRNPALQALWYLLGWKINGELVAGMGVETNSINLQGFIQAANDAETQGFFSDCALSTGDNHETNIGVIESSCSGRLLDPGGLYTFKVAIDDTANIAVALDENDIIGGFEWVPSKKLRDQANIINGQYIDPGSLYQPRSFPEVRDATFIANDGFKRRANNVYAAVQDPAQAQKLAWIQLKETRFQGVFKAPFNYRAFQAVNWDVITLSLPQYNFVNKLFRIIAYELSTEGAISLTLEETDPSIYVSGAIATVPAASVGSAYNARERIAIGSPAVIAVAVNSDGVDTQDGLKVTYTLPSTNVKWVEILYKRSADTIFIATSNVPGTESSYIIASLSPNTSYDVKLRTVSISNVPGNYTSVIVTTTGNNSVTAFSNVGGTNKPENNATNGDPYGASFNLLGVDAGPVHPDGYTYYLHKSLSDVGVKIGEYLSASALMTSTDATANYGIKFIIYSAANAPLSAPQNFITGTGTDAISKFENILVPTGADNISVFLISTAGTGMTGRNFMLNRGPVALPYVAPYIDGADVTSANTAARIAGQGALALLNSADWPTQVTGVGKPQDNASANSFTLVGTPNGISILGNTVTKSGSVAGWDEQVYTKESYTGGAFASWTANSSNTYLMVGLNNDPTLNASYSSIDYAVYLSAPGSTIRIYENGALLITAGVWAIGDTFAVIYDGYAVKYYHNGVSIYTSLATGINKKLYLDSSFYSIGASVKNINFGPLASAPWQGINSIPIELTDGRITAGLNNFGYIDFSRAHLNKSLLNVDSTANTKLSGIAPLATVGDPFGSSYNLLSINAGPTQTVGYNYYTHKPLVDLGLKVGDTLSLSGLVTNVSTLANAGIKYIIYNSANASLSAPQNGVAGIGTDLLSKFENIIIPVGANNITVFSVDLGTANNSTVRNVMFNRGPVALPYMNTYIDAATVGAIWGNNVTARPIELTDGRVATGLSSNGQLAQNLKYSTLMDQGNGVGRTPLVGLETGTARHGDAITFVTPYSSIPSVQWLPSGKTTDTTLIGDAVTSYDALNLTTTGFTASILLKELAGTPAAHTDTLAGASPYDFGIVKTATTPANAWDDTYTFNGFVTVQNIGVSEPGQCLVGLYVLASGTTWVKYGSVTVFGGIGSLTTGRPFSTSVTVTGVTNMTGAQFAVMLESSLVPGSVITGFTNVTYSTATAPNSVNAVPVGASPIPYRIFQ